MAAGQILGVLLAAIAKVVDDAIERIAVLDKLQADRDLKAKEALELGHVVERLGAVGRPDVRDVIVRVGSSDGQGIRGKRGPSQGYQKLSTVHNTQAFTQ